MWSRLGPERAHLFVGRQVAARDFLVGGGKVGFFFGRELNHRKIGIEHHHPGDFVLLIRSEPSRGFNRLVEQFGHGVLVGWRASNSSAGSIADVTNFAKSASIAL